jgi:hypothetical protein
MVLGLIKVVLSLVSEPLILSLGMARIQRDAYKLEEAI